MSGADNVSPVVAPKQERSARSMERILAATEKLLETRSFEEISVTEIVRKAHSSVGSFYARFADKEALLPALHERQGLRLARERTRFLESADWSQLDLRQIAERLVREMAVGLRSQQGLMRAIGLYARTRSGPRPTRARASRVRTLEAAHALLLARRDEINHPDPELAVRIGLFMVGAACREKILFGGASHAAATEVSDQKLIAELTHALVAYLRQTP
jgi:AcrR family transcriptional regulator